MNKSLRAQRETWWNEKHIGKRIETVGGLGAVNFENIIAKNPKLFKTKEECKEWLQNKIIFSRAPIETKTARKKQPKKKADKPLSEVIVCPNCGQQNIATSGSGRKCRDCGFNIPGRTDKIIGKNPYAAHPKGEGSGGGL